jgi:hypothetical protein
LDRADDCLATFSNKSALDHRHGGILGGHTGQVGGPAFAMDTKNPVRIGWTARV